MLFCQNDDVAERDGGSGGEEQRLDEADGHRPQGAAAPRLRRRVAGSGTQPVSFGFVFAWRVRKSCVWYSSYNATKILFLIFSESSNLSYFRKKVFIRFG